MANDPLPLAQRAPRVAALGRELDELHRVEEALVARRCNRGGLLRPPLAVCAARGGAGRQGRGQDFARRLINEDATRILPVFCFFFRPGPTLGDGCATRARMPAMGCARGEGCGGTRGPRGVMPGWTGECGNDHSFSGRHAPASSIRTR
jgi:hypothetical protein